jgi:hypothetical protein
MTIQRLRAERMGTAAAVILVCLAVFTSACSLARQTKKHTGATIVVLQTGGEKIKGELVGVRPDALVLDTKRGGTTIPLSDIRSVWTVKKMSNDAKTALAIGGLFGGIALGVGAAKLSNIETDDMGDAIGLGSLFLFGGILVGEGVAVLIGTRTKKGDVYDLTNSSPEEIELMLADLRKIARVPDYR